MGSYKMELAEDVELAIECEEDAQLPETAEGEEPGTDEFIEPETAEYISDATKLYLRDIQKSKLLTAEEEKELAERIELGDQAARDRMITCNLRLVVKIAKRYLNRGLPLLDLIEEGNLGLIKAVERFEISRGFRFSTYATWWIRQCVERALMNQGSTIRLPVHVAEDLSKIYRVSSRFRREMNREPTITELAESLEMEPSRVRKLQVLTMKTYSLDQPMGEHNDYFLGDMLEDTSSADPDDRIENVSTYQRVSRLLEGFSEPEKKILALRFGLGDQEPQTLETIGKSFGLTRERIRQIESGSLIKLRLLMKSEEGVMASC
jgi:RNA polymerase primary sigma factor